MAPQLQLDESVIRRCHDKAARIAQGMQSTLEPYTTLSIERATARFLGVDGVDGDGVPLPNVLVDHLEQGTDLPRGISYWLGNAMLELDLSPSEIAIGVAQGALNLRGLPCHAPSSAYRVVAEEVARRAQRLLIQGRERAKRHVGGVQGDLPQMYVLTATGDVYEDIEHAVAVAEAGGDIIAVIRSTAQSLLDYVPYGPTTEGYGGTYATQANLCLMREALDRWSEENGRYMKLSSFSSGLCMAEIAVIGVLEGLDNMVNDALYGILYRDINSRRNLVDQRVARMLCGYFGVVINTGEDNYLRTTDAVEAAPSVVASQFINYHVARQAGVPPAQIGIGNAFEIDPALENGLLYEWAQAQLTRQLFPDCPVKYMPPTRHMNGNAFRTHACDTLFSLITLTTGQAIQTVGVPTEGVHTPHIHDRVLGLENARYVFRTARDLGDEIEFRRDGRLNKRARDVLGAAADILAEVEGMGLLEALGAGFFGGVARSQDGGRGMEGLVKKAHDYRNPLLELLENRDDA